MNCRFSASAAACAVLLVAATFLPGTRSAVAAPIFGITGGGTAQTFLSNPVTEEIDSGGISGGSFSFFSSMGAGFGSAAALVTGSAAMGRLAADAAASVIITPDSFPTFDGSLSAEADVIVGWFDTLTLQGVPGTSSAVTITVTLHAVPSGSSAFGGGALAVLSGGVSPPTGGKAYELGVRLGSTDFSPFFTFVFPGAVGDEIHIQSLLHLGVSAISDAFSGESKVFEMNALSTGTMFADVADAGFSLQSASGHDYSSILGPPPSVPESSSLALLVLGMLALLGRRPVQARNRRRRKTAHSWSVEPPELVEGAFVVADGPASSA